MSDLIICPHCGKVVDLTNPKLKHLTQATFAVWHALKSAYPNGERITVKRAAELASMDKSSAYYHLKKMRRDGLVKAIPKRTGGTYHVYVLAS